MALIQFFFFYYCPLNVNCCSVNVVMTSTVGMCIVNSAHCAFIHCALDALICIENMIFLLSIRFCLFSLNIRTAHAHSNLDQKIVILMPFLIRCIFTKLIRYYLYAQPFDYRDFYIDLVIYKLIHIYQIFSSFSLCAISFFTK